MQDTARPLLVLDVDETLVHCCTEPLPGRQPDFVLTVPGDFPRTVETYYGYLRPHVRSFLSGCAELFDLAVWSAGGKNYLAALLPELLPEGVQLRFVYDASRCIERRDPETQEKYNLKDLSKLKKKYSLSRLLLVEDTPANASRHYGNLVRVKPFHGETDDEELLHLQRYLARIHAHTDFRRLEKRGWRAHVSLNSNGEK